MNTKPDSLKSELFKVANDYFWVLLANRAKFKLNDVYSISLRDAVYDVQEDISKSLFRELDPSKPVVNVETYPVHYDGRVHAKDLILARLHIPDLGGSELIPFSVTYSVNFDDPDFILKPNKTEECKSSFDRTTQIRSRRLWTNEIVHAAVERISKDLLS